MVHVVNLHTKPGWTGYSFDRQVAPPCTRPSVHLLYTFDGSCRQPPHQAGLDRTAHAASGKPCEKYAASTVAALAVALV
eukprot:1180519-Prorocentrum_minimum.AAC.2